VLTNDPALTCASLAAGAGLTCPMNALRDMWRAGSWWRVLEEFSTPFPGFYLYYPERAHASPALRALVEYSRRQRSDSRPAEETMTRLIFSPVFARPISFSSAHWQSGRPWGHFGSAVGVRISALDERPAELRNVAPEVDRSARR